MRAKIKFVADVVRWFDWYNGNTYHSVRVQRCRDGAVLVCPMTYGYSDHYRQTALEAMAAAKWLPVAYRGDNDNGSPKWMCYERDNGYPISWHVSDSTKRDCKANGEE